MSHRLSNEKTDEQDGTFTDIYYAEGALQLFCMHDAFYSLQLFCSQAPHVSEGI